MREPAEKKHYFDDRVPLFSIGQIIRHQHYGYRGVVVDFDMRCLASDDWYHGNRTQPERDQPWYHVMVDGSSSITYAAEDNLLADGTGEPVDHPLIDEFFDDMTQGRYPRNDEIWPGWG